MRGEQAMNNQVTQIARATAEQLAIDWDQPVIVDDVEAELHDRGNGRRPVDYLDPVALGGLIVSIANLAWLIYTDRRKAKKSTSPSELTAAVVAELPESDTVTAQDRERVITIIVTETIRAEDQ